MASRNPWQKRSAHAPRYDSPRAVDPFARFSKTPNALARIESFRSRLAAQGNLNPNGKIPARYRNDMLMELADMEEAPTADDLKDDRHIIAYKRRADESGRLTREELISLVNNSVDQVVTGDLEGPKIAGVDEAAKRAERLEEKRREYGSLPDNAKLIPFLVNVTWTFASERRGTGRKSPDVEYAIEGIFYGTNEEEVLDAAHDFIVTHIRPAVQGGGDRVIDGSTNPDGSAESRSLIESAGAEVIDGAAKTKAELEENPVDPNVRGYFRKPNGSISLDRNFNNPGIRYRVVDGRYEAA